MDNPIPQPEQPDRKAAPSDASIGPQPSPQTPSEIRHADGRIEHPLVKHEPHVIPFRSIMAVILALVLSGAAIFFLVWIFFEARNRQQLAAKTSNYPLATPEVQRLPAEPRLEPLDRLTGNQASDFYQRELAKQRQLNTYGPTDDPQFVHIPIEDAMKMVVAKLPVRRASDRARFLQSRRLARRRRTQFRTNLS